MQKFITSLLLSLMLLSLLGAPVTVFADDNPHTRSGYRFTFLSGDPTTFQAGDPFHFAMGNGFAPPDEGAIGLYNAHLDVDGIPVEISFVEVSSSYPLKGFFKTFVINFPDGLPAGTHTFTGYWTGPCQVFVDWGTYPGPCSRSNEIVQGATWSMTVEFLP